MNEILWYKNSHSEKEIQKVTETIRNGHVGQGPISKDLESRIAKALDVPYVLTTANGSISLLMSMMALDIGPGDEVIVPNRTWIATAHAPLIVGAKVKLVDVLQDIPIMDVSQIRKKITSKTKAIIPVHLNGRSVDMKEIKKIAKEYNLFIVEDACQAIFSKNEEGYLGTQSDIGCFSSDKNKLISSGLGGIVVTKDKEIYEKLKSIRHHGVKNKHKSIMTPPEYYIPGFNFRLSDVMASMGLVQFSQAQKKINRVNKIYEKYVKAIELLSYLKIIPVNISKGEVPVYTEVLCKNQTKLITMLKADNIKARPFHLSLNSASYLRDTNPEEFPNSKIFSNRGLYLPCGPSQSFKAVDKVIEALYSFKKK